MHRFFDVRMRGQVIADVHEADVQASTMKGAAFGQGRLAGAIGLADESLNAVPIDGMAHASFGSSGQDGYSRRTVRGWLRAVDDPKGICNERLPASEQSFKISFQI